MQICNWQPDFSAPLSAVLHNWWTCFTWKSFFTRVGISYVSQSWNSLEEHVQIAEGSPQPCEFLKAFLRSLQAHSTIKLPDWRTGLISEYMRNFMLLCERRRSDTVPSGLRSKVSLLPSPCICTESSILAFYQSAFWECFRMLWNNMFYNHLRLAIYLCL